MFFTIEFLVGNVKAGSSYVLSSQEKKKSYILGLSSGLCNLSSFSSACEKKKKRFKLPPP